MIHRTGKLSEDRIVSNNPIFIRTLWRLDTENCKLIKKKMGG